MYICTQVTSLHLSSLDAKCLVTFKIVLFSLSLGFDQSSVANERILTVKVHDGVRTLEYYSWLIYRSFMDQRRSCG